MNRNLITLATIVTAVTAATLAIGIVVQQAFTKSEVEPIASAADSSVTRIVVLQGKIAPIQLEENTFLLTDSSGTAELFTCPTWYRKIKLDSGEKITVTGHIVPRRPDSPGAKYVVAVHSINRENGSRIEIRTNTGKPPWANGMNIRTKR